jgi:hypothetical protein
VRCVKRGGIVEIVYLDIERAEGRFSKDLVETLTPENIFDARWAMALLGQAMNRLGQEYLAQGKTTMFEALNAFLDPINSRELPTYKDVADQLKISVGCGYGNSPPLRSCNCCGGMDCTVKEEPANPGKEPSKRSELGHLGETEPSFGGSSCRTEISSTRNKSPRRDNSNRRIRFLFWRA